MCGNANMYSLPTELLLYIFTFLSVKELTRCRQVCVRWNYVVDELQKSDELWKNHCRKDFQKTYLSARKNARVGMTWYKIYKSLTLWPKLNNARELRDEFAAASNVTEQIINIQVLPNGIIGVHKKTHIRYFDIETLEPCKRTPVTGDFLRYVETDNAIILLGYHLHLHVIRKVLHSSACKANLTVSEVKDFIIVKHNLFYVDLRNSMFVVDLNAENFQGKLVCHCRYNIVSLGFTEDKLHLLTFERKILTIQNNTLSLACNLDMSSNILHTLYTYNLLEGMDWRVYLQWMFILSHPIPLGHLRDLIVIKIYGDMVFVGCDWGVFHIYHKPFVNGEFDLFKSEPVKQYNFMNREDCPVLSDVSPILQVDVMESEDGHTVLVAMPKKIAVLEFVHSFKRSASDAMLPYRDIQRVKVLKIDD